MLIYRGRRYLKSNSPASVITNSSPCSHYLSVQSVTLSQWPSQGLICDHLHLLHLLVSLQLYMAKYKLLGQVSSASNTASSGTGSSRGWDQEPLTQGGAVGVAAEWTQASTAPCPSPAAACPAAAPSMHRSLYVGSPWRGVVWCLTSSVCGPSTTEPPAHGLSPPTTRPCPLCQSALPCPWLCWPLFASSTLCLTFWQILFDK